MTHADEATQWLISGRVQGVGFRWFVMRKAETLGLGGWAKNLADGRVEVVASGSERQLKELDRALRIGPRFAKVEIVEKSNYPHEVGAHKSFDIR